MKKQYKYLLLAMAALIILIWGVLQLSQGLETTLIEITPQTLVVSFKEEGTIIPQIERPLYAPTPQTVLELNVVEGQKVKKDEDLALLDTQELNIELKQLQLQQANYLQTNKANLNQTKLQEQEARLQLNNVQKELAKKQSLYEIGAISQQSLEETETKIQLAKFDLGKQEETLRLLETDPNLTTLQTQIELLEYKISKHKITAPIDGIVAHLKIKKGDWAQSNEPLMMIFQDNNYLVECLILEEEAQLLQKDMEITLIQDQKIKTNVFSGFIKSIAPSTITQTSPLGLEEQRVKIIIAFTVPTGLNLLPGAKLDVEFITAQEENVLAVPRSLLFPYEDTEALWVVKKGRAQIQTIEKGLANEHSVVIKSGLKKGDQVIANPHLKGLKNGMKIKRYL